MEFVGWLATKIYEHVLASWQSLHIAFCIPLWKVNIIPWLMTPSFSYWSQLLLRWAWSNIVLRHKKERCIFLMSISRNLLYSGTNLFKQGGVRTESDHSKNDLIWFLLWLLKGTCNPLQNVSSTIGFMALLYETHTMSRSNQRHSCKQLSLWASMEIVQNKYEKIYKGVRQWCIFQTYWSE